MFEPFRPVSPSHQHIWPGEEGYDQHFDAVMHALNPDILHLFPGDPEYDDGPPGFTAGDEEGEEEAEEEEEEEDIPEVIKRT